MNWRDANDFFSMGGYGLYVWGAYGVMALVMAVEPLLAWMRHRAARAAVADEAAAAAQESSGGAPMEARP